LQACESKRWDFRKGTFVEKKMETLSVHVPGNFRNNDLGGEKGKVCPTSALFQKQLFENLYKNE
jgi:D-tyrosyl-tRNA(Tyr) deacylase